MNVSQALLASRLRWAALDAHAADALDVAVLVCLVWHADRDAIAWPSQRTVASWAHCHQRTAQRRLRALAAMGDVEVIDYGTSRSSARYWIACDGDSGRASALAQPVENGTSDAPGRVARDALRRVADSRNGDAPGRVAATRR